MKLASFFVLFTLFASAAAAQTDEEAVKNVITSAYINGIHNGGPIEDIQKGFHSSFNMLRLTENDISPLPIDQWISNIEKSRKENSAPAIKTVGKFISTSVAGNSASVVLELYRNDKKVFTDHLLLYKFEEGWRIVSKIYYRHP